MLGSTKVVTRGEVCRGRAVHAASASWITGRGAIVIEDGRFSYVKPSEGHGTEVHGPDIVGDLFEANVFAAEQMGDVDPGGVPSDSAVGGDLAGLEEGGVVGRLRLLGEGTG